MKLTAERETGFGGGVVFIAKPTGRTLWLKRSDRGDLPGTWCCPGGGIEDNETIEEGVRREVREEAGYDGDYKLHHMHRNVMPGFVYHNHWAEVPEEFEPVLNDEHTDYMWTHEIPEPCHPELRKALKVFSKRMGQ